MTPRTFLLLAAAVTLLALGLREWYVLAAQVAIPVRGDSVEFMRYASNLVHHGTFSLAVAEPIPDAYRGPGYPLFLAAIMAIFRPFSEWLAAVYQAQVVVGALTVAATIALARQWLPRVPSLIAGLLIAIWPHHVVATGSILSETLFGLVIVLALLAASVALRERSLRWAVWSGLAFGVGYLINPLIALFPFVALVVFWRQGIARAGAALLAVSLVAVIGWGIRSQFVAPTPSRVVMNFVQGSWPDFHESYRWQNILMHAWYRNREINQTVTDAVADPAAGLAAIAKRVEAEPLRFAKWYAVDKPLALWGRDIQLGYGGIYFLETANSPYETNPVMQATEVGLMVLNPILTVTLLVYAFVLLRSRDPAALLCGLAVLYLTAVHAVFQAEPRYAIAYRPLEAILLAGAGAYAWSLVQRLGAYQPKVINPGGGGAGAMVP